MAYKMNEIMPRLYLGNIVNSMDMRHLKEFDIAHIVSVYEKAHRRFPQIEYKLIKVCDRETENLAKYFSETNDFIHKARLDSKNVLVHCIKGASRSVTLVVAYIMSITNLGWCDALKVVRLNRPIADPNEGFRNQLENFEKNWCDDERMRLKTSFESKDLFISDEKFCTLTLEKYRISENATKGQGDVKTTEAIDEPH